jgi:transcriptional repressor NrdR
MICPFCKYVDTKVLDSRPDSGGRSIRRRRECISCGKRWRTIERIEDEMPLVQKRNQTYEPFSRDKLIRSMQVSCGKRPVTQEQIEAAVADIEWKLLEESPEFVSSDFLGEQVMQRLKLIDEIAYIRFASVYRRFKDAGELWAEMKSFVSP